MKSLWFIIIGKQILLNLIYSTPSNFYLCSLVVFISLEFNFKQNPKTSNGQFICFLLLFVHENRSNVSPVKYNLCAVNTSICRSTKISTVYRYIYTSDFAKWRLVIKTKAEIFFIVYEVDEMIIFNLDQKVNSNSKWR